MRKYALLASLPLLPLCLPLVGCEDGPQQTFSPASGPLFNDPNTPNAVGDAGQSLITPTGGGNIVALCSGDEMQRQWSAMVGQPVAPVRYMGGLDLSDGDSFPLLRVEEAITGPTHPMQMACVTPGGATNANDPCAVNTSQVACAQAAKCMWNAIPAPTGTYPTRLCQPTVDGTGPDAPTVGGSTQVHWGNNGELTLEWVNATHKVYYVALNNGYTGHMTWNYRTPGDGIVHSYDWQIGQTIKKDGAMYSVDWLTSKYAAQLDELYRGIASTFAPDIYDNAPAGVFCQSTGTCFGKPDGGDGTGAALFGMRPVSFYMFFLPPSAPAPAGSTVKSAYLFNIKYAPYSGASSYFKMFDPTGDAGGAVPFAEGAFGDKSPRSRCHFSLGDSFDNLMKNCVDVFTDSEKNASAEAKVLGNLTHDDQNFTFSVVGINQNFRPVALDFCPTPKPAGSPCGTRITDIIHDTDSPTDDPANNLSNDFQADVRSFGPIENDYHRDATSGLWVKDYHGSGAVWREYGRLVQTDLAAAYHAAHPTVPLRTVHDPACFFKMSCSGGTGATPSACAAAKGTWTTDPSVDPLAWRPLEGCTGFETLVTGAEATSPDDVWDVGTALGSATGAGLKPGQPLALFCNDPGMYNFCGMSGDTAGLSSDLLTGSASRVLQYLGRGNVLALPQEGRDVRYFFEKWSLAYAKYLVSPHVLDLGAANTGPEGPQPVGDFSGQFIDSDDFIFDSIGGGAARSEYFDFHYADASHDPTSVEQQMILIGSNLTSTHFFRRLDREERTLFNALAVDQKQAAWGYLRDGSGQPITDTYGTQPFPRHNANPFLTNFAGNAALAAGASATLQQTWTAVTSGGAPKPAPGWDDPCNPTALAPASCTAASDCPGKMACSAGQCVAAKTAYYCATHLDADCTAAGWQAPNDGAGNLLTRANGKPLLEGYCGVWQPTAFALQTNAVSLSNKGGVAPGLEIVQTIPASGEALVQFPRFKSPYLPDANAVVDPIQVLVPWFPKQEGVGYPVAATGTRDVFVQTAQLDLSGQVITPVLDFLPVPRPDDPDPSNPTPPYGVAIQAYETQDFLGEVFLCVDPVTSANRAGTGNPGDILSAHMYTSAESIIDWIRTHPGAQAACQLVVRYSPYDNYPDYIQSTSAGIRLGIEQGAGYGRVSDVTVFAPGTGAGVNP